MPLRYFVVCCSLLIASTSSAVNPTLEGYADWETFAARVAKLDDSDLVTVESLGTTTGKRKILAITISRGDAAKRPAIAIIGNAHAPQLVGSELALRIAEVIVAKADEEQTKSLLDQVALYIIARPDPDATEKAFASPIREITGNARVTDDDRDSRFGEDPPEDLNGDGWITQMRVSDVGGRWMPHPDDARLLIEADAKKNERGQYHVYTEGIDNDHDEAWNEDGGDGVAFDRNWPHRYPAFQTASGANAVSEFETRAVADFLFDRANVFAVLSYSLEDNLFHPWKPDGGKDKQRIRTTINSADAPYHDFLASKYRDLHGGKDAPDEPTPPGSFAEWSYYQYGRWSFVARPWWVPKVAPPMPKEGEKKPSDEKRGSDELNVLRWLEQEKLDGFVAWQKVEHPDFPGKLVEVGGFKPFYQLNPPIALVEPLVEKNLKFLADIAGARPQIALADAKVESLGARLFRVTTKVVDRGYLPTLSEQGETTGIHQRLQAQLIVPAKTEFLKGSPRVKLGRLDSSGAHETTWLVRFADGVPPAASIRAWSPECGEVETKLELK